jgi:S-DNA-T family DNA segregation ATPase FtsK/SpoIIIE
LVDEAELEAKKDQIIETLMNYKIEIVDIKATVGPTVTLYEIIPAPGVRISRIKNLEDDIALSLAALGIRIIAPIPGKGTIGIEVPNKNKQIVSLREVLASPKFANAKMDLPIVLGKTISNEVFVADLAKMPHLLIAGATGQGKSVGINTVIMSLLYKKHPSQLKFVLVDPKKVELTLFNKIERHFLAKLPGSEEAIITDDGDIFGKKDFINRGLGVILSSSALIQ